MELDINISHRPSEHTTGLGNHLTQLSTAAGAHPAYIEKRLYDFFNIQIYSKIYIGSNKQEFDLIFDTGSAWVWVGTDMCDTCANPHKFDTANSTSFDQLSNSLSTLRYGRGMVMGYDTTD